MKKLLIIFTIIYILIGCDKDDAPKPIIFPVQLLPAATQVGANTFGCLLDGQVFIPGNAPNPLDAQYQLINGEYFFGIDAARRFGSNNFIALGMGTNNLPIVAGTTYQLLEWENGKANGGYFLNTSTTYTSSLNTGQMKITKLDTVNQIVSGTFWYDIIDNQGVKHEIREGRFDTRFTN